MISGVDRSIFSHNKNLALAKCTLDGFFNNIPSVADQRSRQ